MLTQLYRWVTPWANASRRQIFVNRCLGRLANYVYPQYCRLKRMDARTKRSGVIISLTSFPDRINQVHLCIQSLLRQSMPAEKVILYLAVTEFRDRMSVPKKLLDLEEAGLEIRFCDDVKSYKKVIFVAQEFPDMVIITADDDVLYPEDFVERLLNTAEVHPGCVVCYRAHKMLAENGKILPYSQWEGMSKGYKGPSMWLVPTGVGGVLYPPGYFVGVKIDAVVIRKLFPTTDDLWLKAIGIRKNIKVIKVDRDSKEWFTILNTQRSSLSSVNNMGACLNDISLRNLIDYYDLNTYLVNTWEEKE